jgi:hypothetical protein
MVNCMDNLKRKGLNNMLWQSCPHTVMCHTGFKHTILYKSKYYNYRKTAVEIYCFCRFMAYSLLQMSGPERDCTGITSKDVAKEKAPISGA